MSSLKHGWCIVSCTRAQYLNHNHRPRHSRQEKKPYRCCLSSARTAPGGELIKANTVSYWNNGTPPITLMAHYPPSSIKGGYGRNVGLGLSIIKSKDIARRCLANWELNHLFCMLRSDLHFTRLVYNRELPI